MEHRRMHSSFGAPASNSAATSGLTSYARRRGASVTAGASASAHSIASPQNTQPISSNIPTASGGSNVSTRRTLSLLSSPAVRNAGLSMSFPLPSSSSQPARDQNSAANNTTTSSIGERTIPIRRTRYSQQLSESSAAQPNEISTERTPASTSSSRPKPASLSISTSTSTPRRIASVRNSNPPPAVPLKSPTLSPKTSRGQGVPFSSLSRSLTQHRRTISGITPPTSKEDLRTKNEPLSPGPLSPNPLSPGPLSPTSISFSSWSASQPKKSPARFSSNGIATSSGPPPSLAYRNMDFAKPKKPAPPVPNRRSSTVILNNNNNQKKPPMDRRESVTSNDDNDTMDSQRTIRAIDDVKRRRIEQEQAEKREAERKKQEEEMFADVQQDTEPEDNDEPEKGENNDSGDVFFSLARSNTVTSSRPDTSGDRSERRRTRMAQYAQQRSSLPASTFSSGKSKSPARQPEPQAEPTDPIAWRHSTHASPTPSERQRQRQRAESISNTEEVSPKMLRKSASRPRSIYGDASPITTSKDLPAEIPLRNSSLLRNHETASYSPNSLEPEPSLPEPHRRSLQELVESDSKRRKLAAEMRADDDTASTVSTTAPSTVWDELDDLKSRIRRLELTGRMPGPGAGTGAGAATMSNSSGERPRTANTTLTTLSSSSPRNKGSSNGAGASPPRQANTSIGAITLTPPPATHPLLQSALPKTEPYLAPEAFKNLQAAANDALALASYVGSTGQPGQLGSSPLPDRQLRRKVDSMCRSLTEFCISLTESSIQTPLTPSLPPPHHQLMQLTTSRPSPREMLDSPRLRAESSMSSHKPSALNYALRRGSAVSLSTRPNVSPMHTSDFAPSPTTSLPPSRLAPRTSLLKRDTSLRAPSRANTDFASDYSGGSGGRDPRDLSMLTPQERIALRRREREEEREALREREREGRQMTMQSSPPRHSDETVTRRTLDISGRGLVESRLRAGSLSRPGTTRRILAGRRGEEWDE